MLRKLPFSNFAVIALLLLSAEPESASAQQVIYACKNDLTGLLEVVQPGVTCRRGWTALDWNVVGPPGPAGPAGAPGGLSKATVVDIGSANFVTLPRDMSYSKIGSKTLSAGSWAVWGSASVLGDVGNVPPSYLPANVFVRCELRLDNIVIGAGGTGADERLVMNSFDIRTFSMFGEGQAKAGGSEISIWCQYNPAYLDNMEVYTVEQAHITAITLGGFQ
jgi:hypothetical protein